MALEQVISYTEQTMNAVRPLLVLAWVVGGTFQVAGCLNRAEQRTTYGVGLTASGVGVIGVTHNVTLTVQATSSAGAPVPGLMVQLMVVSGQATLSQPPPTDGAGIAKGSLTSNQIGTVVVRAIPTNSMDWDGQTHDVRIDFTGVGSQMVLSASPQSFTAGGQTLLTAILTSASGARISSEPITLTCSDNTALLTPSTGLTDAQGVFTATMTAHRAGFPLVAAATIQASADISVQVTAGAATSPQSSFTVTPGMVADDGSSFANATLQLRDAFANAVPAASVTYTTDGSAINFAPTATGVTDGNGVFNSQITSIKAQAANVIASTSTLVISAPVQFTVTAPSTLHSVLQVAPTTATVGTAGVAITFTVADASGNPVANQAVSIVSSGSQNMGLPATGNTDAAGVFATSLSSTRAELKTITATAGGLTLNANAAFMAGPPAALSLTASPNIINADAVDNATLTAEVQDAYGNPVANQFVSLSPGSSGSMGLPASGNTTLAGQFSTPSFSTTLSGNNIVNATCGALQANTIVQGIAGPATQMAVSLTTPFANQGTYLSFGVTFEDTYGNTAAFTGSVVLNTNSVDASSPNTTYSFTAADKGSHTFQQSVQYILAGSKVVNANAVGTAALSGNTTTAVAPFYATSMALETQAATAHCLNVPGANNQVGARPATAPCSFHSDQVFYAGNDNSLRVMGQCVEVQNAAYAANANVQLNVCNGTPQQMWTFNGNTVQSIADPAYCLDAGTGSGEPIVMNDCTSPTVKPWVYHVVSPTFNVFSGSGFVLDLANNSYTDSNPFQAYKYSGSSAQFLSASADATWSSGDPNQAPTIFCLDVSGAVFSPNTIVDIFQCNQTAAQWWVQMGNTLRPRAAPSLCLDIRSPLASRATLQSCSGAASQALTMQVASGYYRLLENANTNMCVAIAGSISAGSPLETQPCTTTYAQEFQEMHAAATSFMLQGPETPLYLDPGPYPAPAGSPITLQNASTDPCSILWELSLVGDTFVYQAANTPSLCIDSNTSIAGAALITASYSGLSSQSFYRWPLAQTWQLSTALGQCLGATLTPPVPGTPIQIAACTGATNQQWVYDIDGTIGTIQNGGLCIDTVGAQSAANLLMQLSPCDHSDRQKWNVLSNLSAPTAVSNVLNSALCLDSNGATTSGSPLTVQNCSSASSQLFKIQ